MTDLAGINVTGLRYDVFMAQGWHINSWANTGAIGQSVVSAGLPATTPRNQTINSLRSRLEDEARLTADDLQAMRSAVPPIKLNELLQPGIHHVEFNVAGIGEHHQWVLVRSNGSNEIISARDNGAGVLQVLTGSWESSVHGRGFTNGEQRFATLPQTVGRPELTEATWYNMLNEALDQGARGLNYHYLQQNSNSLFNTVAEAGGINYANDGGWAPGMSLNLDTVAPGNQYPAANPTNIPRIDLSAANDVYTGGSGEIQLHGGDGNDVLAGNSMRDAIYGDAGNDVINIAGGAASGGAGHDSITGTSTVTVSLEGLDGNDTLYGSLGADAVGGDQIDGGPGADYLHGRKGWDGIYGGAGSDTILGGQGYDQILGGDDNDQIYGDLGNDNLAGNRGNDTVEGGDGNDGISGGEGFDRLYGGAGNDTLRGGFQEDWLYGGSGADRFVFSDYEGIYHDSIGDFERGVDKIDLTDFLVSSSSFGGSLTVTPDVNGGVKVQIYTLIDGHYEHFFVRNVSTLDVSDFIFPF